MSDIRKGKTPNLAICSARDDACKILRDSWHEVLKTLKWFKDNYTRNAILNCVKLETPVKVVVWNERSNSHFHCRSVPVAKPYGSYDFIFLYYC